SAIPVDPRTSANRTEISSSAPPGCRKTERVHHLHNRRFNGEGPYPITRITTPPGPRNGALHSLHRGGAGNAPQTPRPPRKPRHPPDNPRRHTSSTVSPRINHRRYTPNTTPRPTHPSDTRSKGRPAPRPGRLDKEPQVGVERAPPPRPTCAG